MPSNDEICRMEATELAGRVRNRELSPVEVVEAALDRVEKLEPTATVPAGFTKGGLPVRMQIVGRHLDDMLVLRASAAF